MRVRHVVVGEVVLVERPVRDGIGPGDGDLQLGLGDVAQKREFLAVVRLLQRERPRHRGLRVVLVVEGTHTSPPFEAVGVGHGPGVHLGPLLLAVVHGIQSCRLLQPQAVPTAPPPDLVLVLPGLQRRSTEEVDELAVPLYTDPLTPAAGLLQILVLQLLARERLHPPPRLVQRPDLVREQWQTHDAERRRGFLGHASCSFRRAETSPSRATF
jgi:hypothetical protein